MTAADPEQLDCPPPAWGRALAGWVPTVEEIDRRPTETTPEDFGAA